MSPVHPWRVSDSGRLPLTILRRVRTWYKNIRLASGRLISVVTKQITDVIQRLALRPRASDLAGLSESGQHEKARKPNHDHDGAETLDDQDRTAVARPSRAAQAWAKRRRRSRCPTTWAAGRDVRSRSPTAARDERRNRRPQASMNESSPSRLNCPGESGGNESLSVIITVPMGSWRFPTRCPSISGGKAASSGGRTRRNRRSRLSASPQEPEQQHERGDRQADQKAPKNCGDDNSRTAWTISQPLRLRTIHAPSSIKIIRKNTAVKVTVEGQGAPQTPTR